MAEIVKLEQYVTLGKAAEMLGVSRQHGWRVRYKWFQTLYEVEEGNGRVINLVNRAEVETLAMERRKRES